MAVEFWRRARDGSAAMVGGVSWFRAIVVAELTVFLLLSVALTIAPWITLSALAEVTAGARDFSLGFRPVVAFLGLLLVAATTAALRAVLRMDGADAPARPTDHENMGIRTTRPAA